MPGAPVWPGEHTSRVRPSPALSRRFQEACLEPLTAALFTVENPEPQLSAHQGRIAYITFGAAPEEVLGKQLGKGTEAVTRTPGWDLQRPPDVICPHFVF